MTDASADCRRCCRLCRRCRSGGNGRRAVAVPPACAHRRRRNGRAVAGAGRCRRPARRRHQAAGQRPVAAAAHRQRAARFGLASPRRFARKDQAEHGRELAEARRAACGHRPRAEKHHRSRHPGDLAAGRAGQQTVAWRIWAVAHGSDHPGWPAEGLLRFSVHARQQDASRTAASSCPTSARW